VSAWEICVKHALGKLPLPSAPDAYVPDRRDKLGIASLFLEEADVLSICRLPRLHRDPFDRMLVAQAIACGLTLLTPDPAVRAYPCVTWWDKRAVDKWSNTFTILFRHSLDRCREHDEELLATPSTTIPH
jgi:hypothetical protein